MNGHIKLETAQLIKQLDYSIYCTTAYINRSYLCDYHVAETFYKWTCKEDFPFVSDARDFMMPGSEPWFPAPLQSVLQKWLRDEHNIHISIYPLTDENNMYGWRINVYQIFPHKEIYRDNSNKYLPFEKYEDALETALQEALTHIQKNQCQKQEQ